MAVQSENPNRQVFLSYTRDDREAAARVAAALNDAGLKVWVADWELNVGDNIPEKMDEALKSSDIVLVLFSSKSVGSPWLTAELQLAQKLTDRAITVIPAMIDQFPIPLEFSNRPFVDLSHDISSAAQRLADQLNASTEIDFTRLSPRTFEELVGDLLTELGFSVERRSVLRDEGVDFVALHSAPDPFGTARTETWYVEVKLYKEQRVSVSTIRQMLGYLAALPGSAKGLLITNGQLTSEARKFLSDVNNRYGRELRSIDGTELKSLLLQKPNLTRRYFPHGVSP